MLKSNPPGQTKIPGGDDPPPLPQTLPIPGKKRVFMLSARKRKWGRGGRRDKIRFLRYIQACGRMGRAPVYVRPPRIPRRPNSAPFPDAINNSTYARPAKQPQEAR